MFYWSGITPLGINQSGYITARHRHEVKKLLRAQTVIVKHITTPHRWQFAPGPHAITLLLQQLGRILHTNVPLVQALSILQSCQTHPVLLRLLAQIQRDLAYGASFTEALLRHPRWFDPLVCALMHLGERTGTLSHVIEEIVLYKNKYAALKQQLTMACIYPMTVIFVASLATLYLLLTVVPQLQTFFHRAHQPLPWSTEMLIVITRWIKCYGGLVGGISLIGMVYLKFAYHYGKVLRTKLDTWILHLPGIGRLCRSMYLARAFQALSLTQRAHLPLPEGLQLVAFIIHNYEYQQAFLQMRHALQHGDSMRSTITNHPLFPELVVQILSLGEDTGNLPILLSDLAHYYAQTVEDTMQSLSRWIEPALMILLGVMVGGLILCMYLPMIQLGSVA